MSKEANRKSVTFRGPWFEPEVPQLFLPKWSRIPKTSPPEAASEVPTRLDRRAINDALGHFGIDPDNGREVPDVDLFATAKNRLFPEHVEGSNDSNGAFEMNWGCHRLGLMHAPSEYMPKVVDKVIRDGSRSIVVYVAGRQKDAWMKKLRLITLSEYRLPKAGPGLMSEDGVGVVTPKPKIALVDGTLFNSRDVGRQNVLKVGAQTWDIGNRGIEDVGIIEKHECVHVGADDSWPSVNGSWSGSTPRFGR